MNQTRLDPCQQNFVMRQHKQWNSEKLISHTGHIRRK